MSRKCTKCNEYKTLKHYHKHSIKSNGDPRYFTVCKECLKAQQLERYHNMTIEEKRQRRLQSEATLPPDYRKKYDLENKYGMTLEQFNEMLIQQEDACYLCRKVISGREIKVDHNHKNGKVRKLLCHKCNSALGLLNEDVELMARCIEYIKQHD